MHQRNAGSFRRQRQRPVQCRIAAAKDDQLASVKIRRVLDAVVKVRTLKPLVTLDAESARLKGSHTGRNDNGAGIELGTRTGEDAKPSAFLLLHFQRLFTEVKAGTEGLDLL